MEKLPYNRNALSLDSGNNPGQAGQPQDFYNVGKNKRVKRIARTKGPHLRLGKPSQSLYSHAKRRTRSTTGSQLRGKKAIFQRCDQGTGKEHREKEWDRKSD